MKDTLFLPINLLLKQAIKQNVLVLEKLHEHENKSIEVNVKNSSWCFYVIIKEGFIRLTFEKPAIITTSIGATRQILWQIITTHEQNIQTLSRLLDVHGDIEFLLALKKILMILTEDREGLLASFIGDYAAHVVTKNTRKIHAWTSQQCQEWQLDTKAYLRDELALLVTRQEVDIFNQDVNILRQDVERAVLRTQRLVNRLLLRKTNI